MLYLVSMQMWFHFSAVSLTHKHCQMQLQAPRDETNNYSWLLLLLVFAFDKFERDTSIRAPTGRATRGPPGVGTEILLCVADYYAPRHRVRTDETTDVFLIQLRVVWKAVAPDDRVAALLQHLCDGS